MNLSLVHSAHEPLELCDLVANALRKNSVHAKERKVKVEVLVSERIFGFNKHCATLAFAYQEIFRDMIENSAPGSTIILTHTLNKEHGATLGFAATSIEADSREARHVMTLAERLASSFDGEIEFEKLKFEGMRVSIICPPGATMVMQ